MTSTERAITAAFALRKASLSFSAKENAEYTATTLKGLSAMAQQTQQPLLAHLLDLAATEARFIAAKT